MTFNGKKIVITGGSGFLGRAVTRKFRTDLNGTNTIVSFGSKECDLRHFRETEKMLDGVDLVIHVAGNVGGIYYNLKHPGQLFYENLIMGLNVIECCRRQGVKKVVIVGTICSFPKYTKVPFREDDLFLGYPEETNAAYGIAKRSLLVMSQAYRKEFGCNIIYLLPVNLYGIGDPGFFNIERAHVIPDMIRKMFDAKDKGLETLILWGSGNPTREFLNVDDAARGIFLASKLYDKALPVNLGAGFEISMKELAEKIRYFVGYEGNIVWDKSYPDGQPRRLLDITRAKEYFNFEAEIDFDRGLEETINWYMEMRKKDALE